MEAGAIIGLMVASFAIGWVWQRAWYKIQVHNLIKRQIMENADLVDELSARFAVQPIQNQPNRKITDFEFHSENWGEIPY